MSLLFWALVLLLAGCVFLVLEFFVPSSGTLGVLAALSFVAAIVLAFMAGPVYGTATFVAVLIIVPTACLLAVKYWPETPIGRMMLIQRPQSPDEVLPETEAYRGMQHLVGRHGLAKSLMMPGGVVEIDHKSYDAVSDGTAIEPGTRIIVVSISTQRVVVRPDDNIPTEHFAEEPLVAQVLSDESDSLPTSSSAAPPLESVMKDFENPFDGAEDDAQRRN
jgi:membrane-bound ClpP family serine protease